MSDSSESWTIKDEKDFIDYLASDKIRINKVRGKPAKSECKVKLVSYIKNINKRVWPTGFRVKPCETYAQRKLANM